MKAVLQALAKAFGQLTESAVLKVLAKSIALTLLVFVGLGFGVYWSLDAMNARLDIAADGFVTAAAAIILTGLAAWFLFRLVAIAVLQFFADEIVTAVEVRHYPLEAQKAKPLPFREDLANSVRGIGRTVGVHLLALPVAIVLLVTGIGPALVFLGVNAWLLGRELTDMAWLRHRGEGLPENPVPKRQRVLLGGVIAAMMAVPGVNLLAPVIGAAAGTHLTQRWIARKEEPA